MAEQKRVVSRNALPELAPPEADDTDAVEPGLARRVLTRIQTRTEPLRQRADKPERSFRLRRAHVALAGLALVIYLRPFLIPALLLLVLLVGLVWYLTLGPDRVHEQIATAWAWLLRKHPKRAETLRRFAQGLAPKFDALRNWLPESWCSKLALSELSGETETPETLDGRPDPFERLKKTPEVYRG